MHQARVQSRQFLLIERCQGNKLGLVACCTLGDMALESLKLLEAKISGFLARHEQVCIEKDDLSVRLREREQAYSLLLDQLRQYERERNEIRDRLEKILNRFGGLGNHIKDEG